MRNIYFKYAVHSAVLFAILLCLQSCKSSDMTDIEADKAAIEQVLKDQQKAWNQGDLDKFMTGYLDSPELVFVGSNGIKRGYDTILTRYKQNYPDKESMGELHFSNLEFVPAGEGFYLVMGKFELNRATDNPSGYFTILWNKTTEGWKIINDHTSG